MSPLTNKPVLRQLRFFHETRTDGEGCGFRLSIEAESPNTIWAVSEYIEAMNGYVLRNQEIHFDILFGVYAKFEILPGTVTEVDGSLQFKPMLTAGGSILIPSLFAYYRFRDQFASPQSANDHTTLIDLIKTFHSDSYAEYFRSVLRSANVVVGRHDVADMIFSDRRVKPLNPKSGFLIDCRRNPNGFCN
jgi:hypothetical protein